MQTPPFRGERVSGRQARLPSVCFASEGPWVEADKRFRELECLRLHSSAKAACFGVARPGPLRSRPAPRLLCAVQSYSSMSGIRGVNDVPVRRPSAGVRAVGWKSVGAVEAPEMCKSLRLACQRRPLEATASLDRAGGRSGTPQGRHTNTPRIATRDSGQVFDQRKATGLPLSPLGTGDLHFRHLGKDAGLKEKV